MATCDDCGSRWRDPDTLRELYHEKRLSTREIAEQLDCSANTILRWMEKHDIERRGRTKAAAQKIRSKPARFETKAEGYERWRTQVNGTTHSVSVHRLLAVAEFGFEAVSGKIVHHKNGVKWANWPANLELKTQSEHVSDHHESGEIPTSHLQKFNEDRKNPKSEPWHNPDKLRRLYWEEGHSLREVAEILGCHEKTVRTNLDRFGIETRDHGTRPTRGGAS